MKNVIIMSILLTTFFSLFFFPAKVNAEFVFLKDGKIIKGTIIEDKPRQIIIRVAGKKQSIRRADVMRILYTSLKMGKVYIQKRDGTNVLAYIVDEDRDNYICRKELYKPKEFKLNRADILFVAEKNPSGLQGKADMTHVDLTWFPPYDKVKVYNIYAKTRKNDEYKKIASAPDKKTTVKDLKSNTEYYFIVKSVDSDNYESSPSNEIKLKTKNIPPLPPKSTNVEKLKGGDFHMTWSGAKDPDGTIKGYKLYKVHNRKTALFKTLSKEELNITANEKFDRFFIKSFDNLNDDSIDDSVFYFPQRPEINYYILPSYVIPMQNLAKLVKPGFGVTLRGGVSNYFLVGLDLNIETSFIYFKGKTGFSNAPENEVKSVFLAPVQAAAGYSFYPYKALRVSLALLGGICVVNNKYSYFDMISSEKKTVTNTDFEPIAGAGLTVRWGIWPWFFGLAADYRYIFEDSGKISYFSASPCAGIRF